MEPPSLQATLRDDEREITYEVFAYRRLTRAEAMRAIQHMLAGLKRKPKRKTRVKVITFIGYDQ